MSDMLNLAMPYNATKHKCPQAFVKSKPLVIPNYSFFDEHPQVRVRLEDPIRKVPNLTQLLAWCVYADIIIKTPASSNTDQDQCRDSVFTDIAHTCHLISPNKPAIDVLQDLDILAHVPALQQVFQPGPNSWMEGNHGGNLEGYFSYMSDLNQLLVMPSQLHQDVSQPHNHKYIAHQLAILYQCLSQVGGETTLPFRRQIEKGFNDIKHLAEETDRRELNEFCKEWLQDLTKGVQCAVRSFPPQLYSHIKTLAELTKRLHSIEDQLMDVPAAIVP